MSVAQKALLTAAFAILNIAIGIAITSLFMPLTQALTLWLLALLAVVVAALFWPLRFDVLAASPDPTAEPAAALARFSASGVDAAAALNPLCRPTLLDHGRRTPKAVILMHGISNCPHTFVRLGAMLHARGHSVVMPRMPQNGHADRNTDALRQLTAEQLVAYGDAATDVAAGLADEVIVCGISAGGTVAAWIGQNRPVSRVVLVAPFLGLSSFGPTLNMLLMRIMLLLPHISIWKDPIKRDKLDVKPHGYNRQSTRGTG